jgi:hypothetical protein
MIEIGQRIVINVLYSWRIKISLRRRRRRKLISS